MNIDIQTSNFNFAKLNAEWGTRGKDGKSPLKYVKLIDCETEHLENILKTQSPGADYIRIIESILSDRQAATRETERLKENHKALEGFELGKTVYAKKTGTWLLKDKGYTVTEINYETGRIVVEGMQLSFGYNLFYTNPKNDIQLKSGDKYYGNRSKSRQSIRVLQKLPDFDLWVLVDPNKIESGRTARVSSKMTETIKNFYTKVEPFNFKSAKVGNKFKYLPTGQTAMVTLAGFVYSLVVVDGDGAGKPLNDLITQDIFWLFRGRENDLQPIV